MPTSGRSSPGGPEPHHELEDDEPEDLDAAEDAPAAGEAKPHAAKDSAAAAPAAASPSHASSALPVIALAVAATCAAGAALFLLLRRLRRRGGRGPGRAAVSKQQVFGAVLALREPSAALPPPAGAAQGLAGRTLVLSDRLDAMSVETRFGCEQWKAGRQPADRTYWPADVLVAAGAAGVATVLSEPLGLGPLLSLATNAGGTPNPAGRGRTHGGGDFGAAVSVAAGLSHLALAVDELGSARVPAACCGCFVLRTTAGVLPLEGAAVASGSLAAPALLAADGGVLLKAGQALRLPGGGAPTEVLNYLVAEDLFAACGEEMGRMVPAVVAAVKRWAGPDQAQALSLCEWLYNRVPMLAAFMPATQQEAEAATRQQRAELVLAAMGAAADALRRREFVQEYGPWVEAQRGELPQEVVGWWQEARQVDEARYQQAQAAATELQSAMREALLAGHIFVLPTTPGPAPELQQPAGGKGGAAESAAAGFRKRSLEFGALAALSGVPQVALPMPMPGALPLSVSLLAAHKRDLALLQAAAKLGPLLAEEAAALADEHRAAGRQRGGGQPAAGGSQGGSATAGGSPAASPGRAAAAARRNGGRGRSGGQGKAGGEAAAQAAGQAAAAKEEGNAAFRAGRYEEAVRQYSLAVQLDPRTAVYYGNRAMAYLKLGAYSMAEADCDAALKLELSAKTLLRRGAARMSLGDIPGARADFRQVLALEPNNRQAREDLARIEALEGPEGEAGGGMQAPF